MMLGATILLVMIASMIEIMAIWDDSLLLTAIFAVFGFIIGCCGCEYISALSSDMIIMSFVFAYASKSFISRGGNNYGDANG